MQERPKIPTEIRVLVAAAFVIAIGFGLISPVLPQFAKSFDVSVAAASVLAKVERDALMVALADEHPAYQWELNKGYAAPGHLAALDLLGPCELHRRSWRLRGVVERDTRSAPDEDRMPGVWSSQR